MLYPKQYAADAARIKENQTLTNKVLQNRFVAKNWSRHVPTPLIVDTWQRLHQSMPVLHNAKPLVELLAIARGCKAVVAAQMRNYAFQNRTPDPISDDES